MVKLAKQMELLGRNNTAYPIDEEGGAKLARERQFGMSRSTVLHAGTLCTRTYVVVEQRDAPLETNSSFQSRYTSIGCQIGAPCQGPFAIGIIWPAIH
jgi:hypothetical protein